MPTEDEKLRRKKLSEINVRRQKNRDIFKNIICDYTFLDRASPSQKLNDAKSVKSVNAMNFLSHEGRIVTQGEELPVFHSTPYDDPLEDFYNEAGLLGNEDFLDGFGFAFLEEEEKSVRIRCTWEGHFLCGAAQCVVSWEKREYKWIKGPIGKTVRGDVRRLTQIELDNTWKLMLRKEVVCRGLELKKLVSGYKKQTADFYALKRRTMTQIIVEVVTQLFQEAKDTLKGISNYFFSWVDWLSETKRSTILERILLKKRKVRVKTYKVSKNEGFSTPDKKYNEAFFLKRPNAFMVKAYGRMLKKETT
jgi:hypothetical protein